MASDNDGIYKVVYERISTAADFVANLPHATNGKDGDQALDDCFCGSEYNGTNHIPVRAGCGHIFGRKCLKKWCSDLTMLSANKCPICRVQLFDDGRLSEQERGLEHLEIMANIWRMEQRQRRDRENMANILRAEQRMRDQQEILANMWPMDVTDMEYQSRSAHVLRMEEMEQDSPFGGVQVLSRESEQNAAGLPPHSRPRISAYLGHQESGIAAPDSSRGMAAMAARFRERPERSDRRWQARRTASTCEEETHYRNERNGEQNGQLTGSASRLGGYTATARPAARVRSNTEHERARVRERQRLPAVFGRTLPFEDLHIDFERFLRFNGPLGYDGSLRGSRRG